MVWRRLRDERHDLVPTAWREVPGQNTYRLFSVSEFSHHSISREDVASASDFDRRRDDDCNAPSSVVGLRGYDGGGREKILPYREVRGFPVGFV